MISGALGNLGKFRVWCDESHLVDGIIDGGSDVRQPQASDNFNHRNVRSLILEVMIPRGARTLYGLLGFRYYPSSDRGEVEVRLACPYVTCDVYESSLISNFEIVRLGLPAKYADASVTGLKRAINSGVSIDSGMIEVCYAAYGEVSSNEPIFERIGFVLAQLLTLDREDISGVAVSSLFLIK